MKKSFVPARFISAAQVVLAFVSTIWPLCGMAQNALSDVVGIPPDAAIYPIPGLGFVNLRNGNLHVEMPIRTVKDRNGVVSTTSLLYDSSVWQEIQVTGPNGNPIASWAGNPTMPTCTECLQSIGLVTSPGYSGYISPTIISDPGCSNAEQFKNWQYNDEHGTIHTFPGFTESGGSSECDFSNLAAAASDGSGYWLQVTNTTGAIVYDMHGNIVVGGSKDTNGNKPPAGFDDMLGQPVNLPSGFTVSYKTIYIATDFGTGDVKFTASVLSSLTLPGGRAYSFSYDDATSSYSLGHYGSLTGITLPTGGQVTIVNEVATVNGQTNVATQQVTTPNGTWSFSYSGGKITATAPPNPATAVSPQTTCTSVVGGSDTVSIYAGSATGTPLQQITRQYGYAGQVSSVTTLENGQSSQIAYTYADVCTPRISLKKEYNFSGLLRQTSITYLTSASDNTTLCTQWNSIPTFSDNYLNNNHHITDIPHSVTVYGPSGAVAAQTEYTYDSTTLSTTSGFLGKSVLGLSVNGQPIHDDTNFGSAMKIRGNLTSISQLTTNGTFITTNTSYYNVLGELIESVDGNNNATYYDYTDDWADSSCISTPVFAYPTTVKNALGQLTQTTYNSCDGSVASVQDQNDINAGRSGTVYTYDGLQRTTNVAYPDGGNTAIGYGGSSVPEVITTTISASPNPSQVSSTTLDGLGRPLLSTLANGAQTANGYSYNGKVCATSNPSVTAPPESGLSCNSSQNQSATGSAATDGISYWSYDALGRVTGATASDGSTQSWSYNQNTVTYTDGNNNQWERFSDPAGRLIEVLEPSGTSTTPSIETDYVYDALDDVLSVTQWGGANGSPAANGPVTRTFNYDGLGRLLCSSNPEINSGACPATPGSTYVTGTTAYNYDGNGNVLSKIAPAPNAPSGSTQTVTNSYTYDGLNRLTWKKYSDGVTPKIGIGYDGNNENGTAISGLTNTIGRVSRSSNESNATSTYSYDAMGRVLQKTVCLPSDCSSDIVVGASYDLAGNIGSLTNGSPAQPIELTYHYDDAGRLSLLQSNWTPDANHPATLFQANSTSSASPAYSPANGLMNASMGIPSGSETAAITLARTYDHRQRPLSETDSGFTIVPGTAGSATLSVAGLEQYFDPSSVTINGSEQSKQVLTHAATTSSGTVSISGSEQSKQVVTGQPTAGTGTITISGGPAGYQNCTPSRTCTNPGSQTGTITVTVNGASANAGYGPGTTSAYLAQQLAESLNGISGITATYSGSTITITATTTGSGTNYPVSSSESNVEYGTVFYVSAPPSLNGGSNGSTATVYDSGTATATLNGCTGSYNWGQNDSPSSIASGVASSLNASCGTLVSAGASGSGILLSSKATGSGTNWPLATGMTHNSSQFSSPSFSASAGGMSGGTNAVYTTVYDSGTVSITNNGNEKSVSYGQNDTPTTIAAGLANAINADSSEPITTTASGGLITLKMKPGQNFTLVAGTSYNSSEFSSPSFEPVPAGGIADTGSVTLTINGTAEAVSYGNGDTPYSMASKLAAAFSGDTAVSVSASGSSLNVEATAPGATTDYAYSFAQAYNTTNFSIPSFTGSPASGDLSGGTNPSLSTTPQTLYSYTIPSSGGYDGVGNLKSVADTSLTGSVMGGWGYSYDTLNRLVSGTPTSGPYAGQYGCWGYDVFGNRTLEAVSTTACSSSPAGTWAHYTTPNNHVTGTNLMPSGYTYDAAGNVLDDGVNNYLYDSEGRICAVESLTTGGMTGYVYDPDGHRVGKGTISSFSCNQSSNGFSATNGYVVGLAGEQLTETNGTGGWYHTNVFAGGQLLATYGGSDTYYALNDWVGTKRAEHGVGGCLSNWLSLPFGSALQAAGNCPDATEHHYTGKERDGESGNDYFEARYFGSSMGRFMSPDFDESGSDPDPVPYADYSNPQSLNLYAYVNNNPLTNVDSEGHGCFDNDATSSTDANGDLVLNGNCDWGDFLPTQTQVSQFVDQVKNTAQQAANQFSNIMNTPGGAGCMAGLAAGGAGAGAAAGGGVGLVGLAGGGVGVAVTEPAGLVAGGVGGGASGVALAMTVCPGGAANGGGGRGSGSSARLTKPQQRQTAKYLGMKEVKGLTSQGQPVFEKDGRYFSFSNTSHTAGEVFKEVDRSGNRIATTDLNLNRIGP